jgi:recombination protein RecR
MPGEYPQAMDDLIGSLAKLPGIGRRTAERLAASLMDWDEGTLADLGTQLIELKKRIGPCDECGNLADLRDDGSAICRICRSSARDRTILCVVELARQIPTLEKCGRFNGRYHVLGGRLSPLDGIEIDDLNVARLYERIETDEVAEVVLSTSPDVEGEATAAFLAEELHERFDVTVSRIALGIPVGSDLTYADAATLAMALDSRREMERRG